jgi:hypothetical protein
MPDIRIPNGNLASHSAMAIRSHSARDPQCRPLLMKIAPLLALLIALGPIPSRHAFADPPSTCTANITGAAGVLNGMYPCSPRAVYNPAKHTLVFTLNFTTPGSGSVMQLTVTVTAPEITPQPGEFTLGAGSVTGAISLKESAGKTAPV